MSAFPTRTLLTPSTRSRAVRPLVAFLTLSALVLAGCVQPSVDPAAAPQASAQADLLAALQATPAPALDGAGVTAWLSAFVEKHHPRITGTPQEKAAGADLAAQLAALGYEVTVHTYNARGLPSVDGPLRAVVGEKKGATLPDQVIVLGAHYDTSFTVGNPDVPGLPLGTGLTLYAAYDNGSGTAMVLEQARLLANVTTQKTLRFVLFNGEEEGLLASAAYAAQLQKAGEHVDAYVGFDMVGINWPSAAGCLCIYAGEAFAAELNPLQEAVAFDLLGYPRSNETVQVFDNHKTRNSDEGSFQSAGFPTMRWAGMKSARDYWAYHKLNDTVETMTKQAGSADLLARGFETTAASAYYSLLALDRTTLGTADE